MGLLLLAIGYLIYYLISCFSKKEGFEGVTYNPAILQKQTSVGDKNNYNATGKWNWSDNIKKIYLDAISRNPYISVDPEASLNHAQTIYTEPAVRQTLAFDSGSPEGQFLLGGVTNQSGSVLKCIDGRMTKVDFAGYDRFQRKLLKKRTTIEDANIPNEIAGFKFLKNTCNPCSALEQDFSCPFQFKEKKRENTKAVIGMGEYTGSATPNTSTTPIWKMLWGLPMDYDSLSVSSYLRTTNKT